jgi:hypothetical protein
MESSQGLSARNLRPAPFRMPPFDLATLVGAASAPVALIIATSIFLSNLTGKSGAMFAEARQLFGEYRERHPDDKRRHLVGEQLVSYGHRLNTLIWATFWLTNAILLFILTVFFTGLSIVVPDGPAWKIATTGSMFLGLLLLAIAVVMEMQENHLARRALYADFAEFDELHHFCGSPGTATEVQELADAASQASTQR